MNIAKRFFPIVTRHPSLVTRNVSYLLSPISYLLSAALCAALPCAASGLDGSAVVNGGGTVTFAGATSTNWVFNADTASHDLVIVFDRQSAGCIFAMHGQTSARILAVGGGGGGGGTYKSASAGQPYGGGGGGGAGGMVETNGLFGAGIYPITIGEGGNGGPCKTSHIATSDYSGADGGDTIIALAGEAQNLLVAFGGGGGGGETDGHSGGSGGGGSMYRQSSSHGVDHAGGAGKEGQGHAGGTGNAYNYGGGGGGADGAGAPASSGGGVGGAGLASDITGASVVYAGGGGGGCNLSGATSAAAGGSGGGGNGGAGSIAPTEGENGTGGGGGGASRSSDGARGGSGVVIVRVASAAAPEPPSGQIPYFDPVGGTNATCTAYAPYAGENTLTSGWWVVSGAFMNTDRIMVSGDVNLLLMDGAELVALKGLNVAMGDSIAIWAQGTDAAAGKLRAAGDQYAAGIGGGDGQTAGTITVNGGRVTAIGCDMFPDNLNPATTTTFYGAGIGGGNGGAGGMVTINGGNVTACCLAEFRNSDAGVLYHVAAGGAGIGGGYNGAGGTVAINGGTVTAGGDLHDATSMSVAATGDAIGGCWNATDSGDLNIPGMKVTDPAGTVATNRIEACRGARVTLEPCARHEYDSMNCRWCGAEAEVWVRALSSSAHIRQSIGNVTAREICVGVNPGDSTNITYTIDPWYAIGALSVNGATNQAAAGATSVYTLNLNNITETTVVVATDGVDPQLLAAGLDPADRYTPAIMNWLSARYAAGELAHPEGPISLGRHKGLKENDAVYEMPLKVMYWFDLDPTEPGWWIRHGFVGETGKKIYRKRRFNSHTTAHYTNRLVTVKMWVSNDVSRVEYAPYRLQGLGNEQSDSFTGNWTSETFKVKARLDNGQPRNAGFLPFRRFTLQPNSFSHGNFEARIEILDPFSLSSDGYSYGWHGSNGDSLSFSFEFDDSLETGAPVEPLKAYSTYDGPPFEDDTP